jgi:hypothetical protein
MLSLSQAPVTLKPFWPLSCLELERQGLRPDELIGGSRSILIMPIYTSESRLISMLYEI